MTGGLARAAVLHGPRTAVVEPSPLRSLGPREVRVRLEGCGICGSNLSVWEGRPWFRYPMQAGAPGHEGWGRIAEVGEQVEHVRVGERVAALSYHAFAEFDVADAAHVVVLPPELDDEPFPGEALGCAMNVFARSEIRAGQTVAIIGIGFLGAVLVALAAQAGARVIAVSRRERAREIARRMGAAETLALGERSEVVGAVREFTSGRGCECVIEATGLAQPLDLAGEITAERGRLVIAGYHQDGRREVDLQLWNWRGLDVINAHERAPERYVAGMRAAVDAVVSGRLDPRPLYTDRFPLNDVGRALDAMRERNGPFLKALLTYD